MNEREPLALPIIEVTVSGSSVWPESPVDGVDTEDEGCDYCGCMCCCECGIDD